MWNPNQPDRTRIRIQCGTRMLNGVELFIVVRSKTSTERGTAPREERIQRQNQAKRATPTHIRTHIHALLARCLGSATISFRAFRGMEEFILVTLREIGRTAQPGERAYCAIASTNSFYMQQLHELQHTDKIPHQRRQMMTNRPKS